ncbi:MAG: MOSC domain-containing protein [Gammaproteobacteria bacterium]|nr:MOSC domain-containing protein [Gammaproteobacteria bacterium]
MIPHQKANQKLASVNLGVERVVGSSVSGIYKRSTDKPTRIEKFGLVGDKVIDKRHHGGPDQAVYVYGSDDYRWWSSEISKSLAPGTFGENLTIASLSSKDICIGDRLDIGDSVVLQVTAPRIPCSTLANRMGDKQFPVKFRRAERPGFYCRVLQSGIVAAGVEVRIINYEAGPRISVVEMFRLYYEPAPSAETLCRILKLPLAIRERKRIESTLQRIGH